MFEKLISDRQLAGANCVIWIDGEVAYQESEGFKNLITKEKMTSDAIFRISSMTKPITSVLALMLCDEGKMSLHDPITKWLPQFSNLKVLKNMVTAYEYAERHITIMDLLTHRAGFTYSEFLTGKVKDDYVEALGGDIDSQCTYEQWLNGLASLPLISQPGELFSYGRATDLLGILIAHIEGKTLGEVMQSKIFAPLAMNDTFFEIPIDKKHRSVANMGFDDFGNLTNLETVPLQMALAERPANMEYQSGGQGLWSTMDDYLKFARLFVENGSSNGVQLLKNETIEQMCSNQLTSYQREHSTLMGNTIFKENHGFGLGVAVVCKKNPYSSIPCSGSVGTVGWPGAYGGWWSADPAQKTISIFLTHSMTTPKQLAKGIGLGLYEAIDIFANY